MTHDERDSLVKFRLALRPFPDHLSSGERLWGHWVDERAGLVLARNNANEVPLAVNDTVRVAKDSTGLHQVVEIVRLAESIVTYTSFEPPVTPGEALEVYDGWVRDGLAVYTEGGNGVMVTAWRELVTIEEVLNAMTVFAAPGWSLWQVFTPEQRLAELEQRVDLGAVGPARR